MEFHKQVFTYLAVTKNDVRVEGKKKKREKKEKKVHVENCVRLFFPLLHIFTQRSCVREEEEERERKAGGR